MSRRPMSRRPMSRRPRSTPRPTSASSTTTPPSPRTRSRPPRSSRRPTGTTTTSRTRPTSSPTTGRCTSPEDAPAVRVLMLSSLWPPAVLGGAEVYAEELSRHGCASGATRSASSRSAWRATTWWRRCRRGRTASTSSRRNRRGSAPLSTPPTSATCGRCTRVLGAVDRFRPDVVHSHSIQGMSALPLRISSRRARRPRPHHPRLLARVPAGVDDRTARGSRAPTQCAPCRAVTAIRRRELSGHGPQVVLCVSEATAREHTRIPEIHDRIRVLRLPDGGRALDQRRPPGAQPVFGYLGQTRAPQGRAHAHRRLRAAPGRPGAPAHRRPGLGRRRGGGAGRAVASSTSASSAPTPRRRSSSRSTASWCRRSGVSPARSW